MRDIANGARMKITTPLLIAALALTACDDASDGSSDGTTPDMTQASAEEVRDYVEGLLEIMADTLGYYTDTDPPQCATEWTQLDEPILWSESERDFYRHRCDGYAGLDWVDAGIFWPVDDFGTNFGMVAVPVRLTPEQLVRALLELGCEDRGHIRSERYDSFLDVTTVWWEGGEAICPDFVPVGRTGGLAVYFDDSGATLSDFAAL